MKKKIVLELDSSLDESEAEIIVVKPPTKMKNAN